MSLGNIFEGTFFSGHYSLNSAFQKRDLKQKMGVWHFEILTPWCLKCPKYVPDMIKPEIDNEIFCSFDTFWKRVQ